ncbi:MAG TPA: VOC family protein [Candidatus Thermoplasmatota archaeon]|nr:VOC family protein [Candidatus Thermoplasmatota archaeon]
MTTPITGLMQAGVHVNDIRRARDFYGKTLGLRETHYMDNIKEAYFEIPGSPVPLAVHQYNVGCDKMGGRPPGTVSGMVFTVSNVEQAVDDLKKKGVTITDMPFKGPTGGMLATIADPDGNEYLLTTR